MATRLYDYRCPSCGATRELAADVDPGPIYVCGCKLPGLVRYWRSRPAVAFEKPGPMQWAAMGIGEAPTFGPTLEELLDTGKPCTRIRDDAEAMTLKEPERAMPEHVQGRLW